MDNVPDVALTLFDEFSRTRTGAARRTESHFAYMNESARAEFGPIRQTLEQWFARYPAPDAPRLRMDFCSTDDTAHLSALFELFVHEKLKQAGFDVACHPSLLDSPNRPDFLVSRRGQRPFLVECVLAAQDRKKTARERIIDEAMDAVDELASADFFVGVTVHGAPTGSLPIGRTQLIPRIATWLGTLDADQVAAEFLAGGRSKLPTLDWEEAGVRLVFEALPKKEKARGGGQRLVGIESEGMASLMRTDDLIAGAVKRKATRYGLPGIPYLIAINVLEFPVDGDDIEAALRSSWGTLDAPKNTRLSGLLLATVWNGMSATKRELQLVVNPQARHQIYPCLSPFDEYDGGTLPH